MRRYLIPATIIAVVLSAAAIATWSLTGLRQTSAASPSIRLAGDGSSFEVIGLNRRMLARLAADSPSPSDWPKIFDVYPGDGVPATDSGMPPMLGDYRVDVDGGRLIFTPRFPLLPGLSYTARFEAPAGRKIAIEDERGETIQGRIEIANEEREWRFLPDRPWRSARYRLGIDVRFEDRAGNNLRRLFDIDLRKHKTAGMSERMFVSFEVMATMPQP